MTAVRTPLRVLAAAATLSVVAPPSTAAATPDPSVQLTQVSGGPSTASTTCQRVGGTTGRIGVDPLDPTHEVATWETGQGAAGWLGRSTDGGRTWTSAPLPGVTTCSGGPHGGIVDPYLAVGPGGAAAATSSWQADTGATVDHDTGHVFLNRDAGPAQDIDTTQFGQRAPVAIEADDPSHVLVASEHFTTAAVAGQVGLPPLIGGSVTVTRSTDGGTTFAAPGVTIATATPGSAVLTAGIAATPRGVVVLVASAPASSIAGYEASGSSDTLVQSISAYRSTDDGLTFSGPFSVGTFTTGLTSDEASGCCLVDMASNRSGDLAATWTNQGSPDVIVARSSDGGATWTSSAAATVPHTATLATVAVLADGSTAVAYDATDAGVFRPMLTYLPAAGQPSRTVALSAPFTGSDITDGNSDTGAEGPEQGIAAVPGGVRVLLTLADQPGEAQGDVEVYQAAVPLTGASPAPQLPEAGAPVALVAAGAAALAVTRRRRRRPTASPSGRAAPVPHRGRRRGR